MIDGIYKIPFDARVRYLERRQSDVGVLKHALNNKDFDAFLDLGHRLKGNAATFGFKALEEIALKIEKVAANKDPRSAADVVQQFEAWVDSVKLDSP